ncbi:unnamed protein product [Adineta steineri]|uniref:Uncharacterized protein n=1 Tax=Adineta steineri TaxID=433720 RepID=A0A813P8L5_9BILA|nr:unnamed protein product [Adineta steineri]CAF3903053.1 unnamed protein product [Adineta steineri]
MNQNNIHILSSTVIKINSLNPLKLSPNDWIIPSTSTISCIYFYDIQQWSLYKKQTHDIFMNIEQLKLSLQKLLEYYPLLTGTLKLFDKDNKVLIEKNNNNNGILFVSAKINMLLKELPLSIEKYTDTKTIPESLQFINVTNSNALFHIRHTRFLCGSVALGITLNHQVADAHSYFQLIRDWIQLYKNLEYQPNVCHQRSLLEPALEEIQLLKNSNPDFDYRRSLYFREEISSSIQQTKQTIIKIFRFTADELNRMKTDAITHLSSDVTYLSTFEVLTAHLYQHVMLARNYTTSSISKLYISTNIRPCLTQSFIPSTYFGNAILFSYLEMNMLDVIDKNSFSLLASRIHKSIEENTANNIRTTLAWIICQTDKTRIIPTWNLDEKDFTISAWNKMGIYSNAEFESNVHPCRVILPQDMKMSSAAILLSTEENDGSIDVYLGLDVNEMKQLEENFDFRKYSKK